MEGAESCRRRHERDRGRWRESEWVAEVEVLDGGLSTKMEAKTINILVPSPAAPPLCLTPQPLSSAPSLLPLPFCLFPIPLPALHPLCPFPSRFPSLRSLPALPLFTSTPPPPPLLLHVLPTSPLSVAYPPHMRVHKGIRVPVLVSFQVRNPGRTHHRSGQ